MCFKSPFATTPPKGDPSDLGGGMSRIIGFNPDENDSTSSSPFSETAPFPGLVSKLSLTPPEKPKRQSSLVKELTDMQTQAANRARLSIKAPAAKKRSSTRFALPHPHPLPSQPPPPPPPSHHHSAFGTTLPSSSSPFNNHSEHSHSNPSMERSSSITDNAQPIDIPLTHRAFTAPPSAITESLVEAALQQYQRDETPNSQVYTPFKDEDTVRQYGHNSSHHSVVNGGSGGGGKKKIDNNNNNNNNNNNTHTNYSNNSNSKSSPKERELWSANADAVTAKAEAESLRGEVIRLQHELARVRQERENLRAMLSAEERVSDWKKSMDGLAQRTSSLPPIASNGAFEVDCDEDEPYFNF